MLARYSFELFRKKLEHFLIPELPIEQVGFIKRRTRDHIANLRLMMETAKEHNRNMYMCFIDYKKAFDCVDHERLWVLLKEMGVIILLLRKLYTKQEATIRTDSVKLIL